ncbi:MAG: flippase [Thermoleophilia bacterium]
MPYRESCLSGSVFPTWTVGAIMARSCRCEEATLSDRQKAALEDDDPVQGLARRLVANTVLQIAGSLGGAFIAFATFLLATHELGPERFGVFAVAVAYTTIPTILAEGGLTSVLVREISRKPSEMGEVLSKALPARAILALLVVLAAAATSTALPFTTATRWAIAAALIGAFVSLLSYAMMPALQVRLRMGWVAVANVVGSLVTLSLSAATLAVGGGLPGFVISWTCGSIVTSVVQFWGGMRLVRIRPRVDWAFSRWLLREASIIGAAGGIGSIAFRVDAVLLATLASSHAVGIYSVAFKYVDTIVMILAAVGTSILPAMSVFAQPGGDIRMRGLSQAAAEIAVAAGVPVIVIGALQASEVLTVLGGSAYLSGKHALQVLAAVPLLVFINSALIEKALLAQHRERSLLALNSLFLLANVVLNVVLIPRWGLMAAAFTTLVTEGHGLVQVSCCSIGSSASSHGPKPFQLQLEPGE